MLIVKMNINPKLSKLGRRKSNRKPNLQISRFFFEQNISNMEGCNSTNSRTSKLDEPPSKRLKETKEQKEILIKSLDTTTQNRLEDNEAPQTSSTSEISLFLPSQNKPNQRTRNETQTSICKFINQSDDDFEIPKKKSKIRAPTKSSNNKKKKQMKIKSAFLKNEEIFSKFITQHSIAENINPEELQLALVLSKSEAEINPRIVKENNCMDNQQISANNIRVKLQEFGFKTTTSDRDYNVPIYLQMKNKMKWASKFTPLTLRNQEIQETKLREKVEKLLSRQFTARNEQSSETSFTLISSFLKNFESTSKFIQKPHCNEVVSNTDFYVLDIFSPSDVKIGHLLKDYRKIPGRDLSPISRGISLRKNASLEISEDVFIPSSHSATKHTNESLYCENFLEELSREQSPSSHNKSFVLDLSPQNNLKANNEMPSEKCSVPCNTHKYILQDKNLDIDQKILEKSSDNKVEVELNTISFSGKVNYSRELSPDLFADCEQSISEEYQSDGLLNTEENQNQNNNFIISYEKYSSEEVKISKVNDQEIGAYLENAERSKCVNPLIGGNTIDLTADSDSNPEHSIKENSEIANLIHADSSQPHQLSQQSSTDDSCIILSDDEVNYSIKAVNKYFENPFDLTFKSSSEETDSNCGSRKGKETSSATEDHNFSFIQLVVEENLETDNRSEDSLEFRTPIKSPHGEISAAKTSTSAKKNLSFSCSKTFDENKEKYISPLSESLNEQPDLYEYKELNSPQDSSACEQIVGVSGTHTDHRFNIDSFENNSINFNRSIDKFSRLRSADNVISLNKACNIDSFLKSTDDNFTEIRENHKTIEVNESFSNVKQLKGPLNEAAGSSGSEMNFRISTYNKSLSDSFIKKGIITPPPIFKRYSSSEKFNEFNEDEVDFSDEDEIDKLVYGSSIKKSIPKNPEGIDQLINAELSFTHNNSPCKFFYDNKGYFVKTNNISPEPDYERMDSPTRFKELYKYGLKPLKKKQAVKILKYIYKHTHPLIMENDNSSCNIEDPYVTADHSFISKNNKNARQESAKAYQKYNNFKLTDCFAKNLLEHDDFILEIDREDYILQTNLKAKIPTVPLPFHIAWFNLVKSSNALHEAILHYEPIDLQEIYQFFKGLGYRYDPKDIKKFFDTRCILFRYDLNDGTNRNTRNIKKRHPKGTHGDLDIL